MPTETRPKLLLIDGHSIAYRAFFALPVENFSTVTGQHTNGVFGFTSMLINVLRDEAPTHVGVAFDVSRQTFRAEIYPEYKANRSKTPDEFRGQLDLVKEVLKALNISFVEKEGFEADDVIGTLATQAEAQGFDVLICTGDRDAFQLVTDNVTVLYPRKGVSDLGRMTPKAVEEKYFATPARYPDLAALVGESSDNLPGVPGVGPKTAAKWLEMYDGLENLAAHAGELKGKAAEAFQERVEDVLRNRQINALVRDLDLPLGPDDLLRRPWNREATHQLFDGLEFRVLRDRLLEALPNEAEIVPEGGFDLVAATLWSPGSSAAWLDEHAVGERTGVDVIGHWGSGTGDISAPWRWPPRTGRRRTSTSPSWTPRTRTRWPPGSPTRRGTRRCTTPKGPLLAHLGARLGPGRADLGHPAGGVPDPPRPADLRSGRPDHPLPEA